ncbi:hypothetical protein BpHYR1_037443 [Brachionus plicatilis]|uniref:Uncharacterized protein n=1 Tax=Brachionus plicatilis TaxID=10195 RepID=A0A3M7SFW4_BRAPC|nr:hypothetical protein BpHYR1_037443 [Brachionus plicatilis]
MNFHALMDEDELMSSDVRKPNASEFEQLVISFVPKRFYSGVEYIIQFKQDPKFISGINRCMLNESYFYCKLCLSRPNKQNIMAHCASYIHLFRYFKHLFPIEYDRIINPNKLRVSVEYVIKLLEKVSKRQVDMDQVPELVLLDRLDYRYREFTENYSKHNRPIDLKNIQLNELTSLNLDEEDRILEDKREEILRNKGSVHNSFVQHLIDSNSEDFISMDTGDQRFVNHKSNLRCRERGSMKSTNIVVKREKEYRIENHHQLDKRQEYRIENHHQLDKRQECRIENRHQLDKRQETKNSPMQQKAENEYEKDVEEVSDDYLRQLATRIMSSIETGDLNFEDEFIECCIKYAELLIYKEYVDIESMDRLQSLFFRGDDLSEQVQPESGDNGQNLNLSPKIPEEPFQETIQNFKESPKIPEEPFQETIQNFKESPKIPEEPFQETIQNFKESPKIPEEPQYGTYNDETDDEFESDEQFIDRSNIKIERDLGY